jgi:hypothetical protein
MKKLIFILLITLNMNSFAQEFNWARNIGSANNPIRSEGGLSADNNGNVYITGSFSGMADMDPGQGVTELSAINTDAFVSKVSPDGNLIWVGQLGGDLFSWGVDVALTPDGGVVVVGQFVGTVDFDPGIGVQNITASSDQEIFVLKLSASGLFQWVRTSSINSDFSQPYSHAVSVDPFGNIAVAGVFNGSMTFSSGSGTATITSINDERDYFLLNFALTGNLNWAKAIGSVQFDGLGPNARCDVASGNDGNVYMIGELKDVIQFDAPNPNAILDPEGNQKIFLACYNSGGVLSWVQKIGGTESAGYTELPTMGSIAMGADNKVYVASRLEGTYSLNDTVSIGSGFSNTSFVAQFNLDGTCNWARVIGTDISGIAADDQGNVFCTGYTGNNENMDIGFSNTIASVSSFYAMPYLLKFDSMGNLGFLFVYDASSPINAQYGYGVTVGGGSVYTSGTLRQTTNFNPTGGNGVVTPINLDGEEEIYLINYTTGVTECIPASQPEISINGSNIICVGESITLTLSGTLNESVFWNWSQSNICEGLPLGAGSTITLTPQSTQTFSVNGVGGACQPGPCSVIEIIVENCLNTGIAESSNFDIVYSRGNEILHLNKVNEPVQFVLLDVAGRIVISAQNFAHDTELNLSNLPSGVYIAVAEVINGNRKVVRFVK